MSERPPNQLVELTLTRLRGFLREPEALFWVFAFPVLMALALGVAFRSQKPQDVLVGVLQVDAASATASTAPAASTAAAASMPEAAPAAPTASMPKAAPAAPAASMPKAAPAAPAASMPKAAPAAPTASLPKAAPAAAAASLPKAAPATPAASSASAPASPSASTEAADGAAAASVPAGAPAAGGSPTAGGSPAIVGAPASADYPAAIDAAAKIGAAASAGAGVGVDVARDTGTLAAALRAQPGLRVRVLTPEESEGALRNGVVQVLVIPAVVPGVPPTYRFDPTRPDNHVARLTVDNALQRAAGRQDAWTAKEEQVLTPGSRYIDWLLPGLLGMNIMGTGLWSVSFAVVWARTHKLLKRMVATPMSKTYYLLSHMLARLGFLILEVALLLLFGYFVFNVTVHGSLIAVSLLCLLGAFSFTGLGLLLSSRATTIEGVSGLMNVAMLPMWLLSGVFFASSNFPDAAQPFIKALPLTALNDALRAVMIEGASLRAVALEIGILSGWGLGTFVLAIKMFRWR